MITSILVKNNWNRTFNMISSKILLHNVYFLQGDGEMVPFLEWTLSLVCPFEYTLPPFDDTIKVPVDHLSLSQLFNRRTCLPFCVCAPLSRRLLLSCDCGGASNARRWFHLIWLASEQPVQNAGIFHGICYIVLHSFPSGIRLTNNTVMAYYLTSRVSRFYPASRRFQ